MLVLTGELGYRLSQITEHEKEEVLVFRNGKSVLKSIRTANLPEPLKKDLELYVKLFREKEQDDY